MRFDQSHFGEFKNRLTRGVDTGEEKEPYESMSRADQKRYKAAMAGYKTGGAASADSDDDSRSE